MAPDALSARVSRRRYLAYREEVKHLPWILRVYIKACNVLRIDPDNLSALPEADDTIVCEGVLLPSAVDEPKLCSGLCTCVRTGGPSSCTHSPGFTVSCPSTALADVECICLSHGSLACLVRRKHAIAKRNVGVFTISDFDNSPQQHAILNRHLLDYFKDRARSQETTPYAIPASQQHLLADLGMEPPQPDAPVVPHGLHKSIEQGQLHRMRNYLAQDDYNLICVKDAKVDLLPKPKTRQNPIREAKDVSRFPGWAINDCDLSVSNTHFMHDVSAEVTPHELVEKLVSDNPDAHLFVTGMNPAEVLDRAATFEPASHHIKYNGTNFVYVFAGSEAEAYETPIDVTLAWINSASICASNGRVYYVVLLDNKLGHCLYHIFCGDVTPQHTRVYPTGSMVRLPPTISGTLKAEYLPSKLLTSVLDFVRRTPDLSTRNLASKVTQVANATNPRTTARERWIAWHIMAQLAPFKTWDYYLYKLFWQGVYVATLQWQMFSEQPDVFNYLDERERYRTVYPTQGGGWSRKVNYANPLQSIPNNPTMLQRLSAFTASAFVFLWPKLLLGEVLSMAFYHTDLWSAARKLVGWMDLKPLRTLLTAAIVVSAAVVPGHVMTYFTSLSGHFWRQLWWPGYLKHLVSMIIVELSGAPGARILVGSPGRGWSWQALLWAIALHTVLPGLVPALVVPWVAYANGWGWLMTLWLGAVVVENVCASHPGPIFSIGDSPIVHRHYRSWDAVFDIPGRLSISRVHCPYRVDVVTIDAVRHVRRPVPYVGRPRTARVPVHYKRNVRVIHAAFPLFGRFINELLKPLHSRSLRLAPAVDSFWRLAFWDGLDACWTAWYGFAWTVNTIHRAAYRFQRNMGNCGRVPMLTALPPKVKPTLKRRNVDRVLPTVVLQPNAPVAPVGSQLAIPPQGLNFPDWLAQVEAAYRANPRLHPALTPGQDCFWQAMSSLGGTPHMWFCWFMEFMRRRVAPTQGVVGGVTIIDMHLFASVSCIGIRLTGLTDEVTMSQDSRPTLVLNVTHVPMSQDLHVELATLPKQTNSVSSFARVMRTLSHYYPNWYRDVIVAFQNAPVDSVPVATPALRAIMGANIVPSVMAEISDAINACFNVSAFTAVAPEGFTLDFAAAIDQGDALFDYLSPVSRLNVAKKNPDKLWEGYTKPKLASLAKKNVGASPRQQSDNAQRNNQRPEPPMWTVLSRELQAKVADYAVGHLPAVGLKEELVSFTADVDRASRLVSDLKAHPAVLGGKADAKWLQSLDSIIDLYRLEGKSVTVPVRAYFGTGGCGKTTATVAYLSSLSDSVRQNVRIVSHTESLRAKAKQAIDFQNLRGVNFPTIPGLLSEPTAGPIVFDDAGKFWGGVLDLVLLVNPMVPEVVVNGDPCQQLTKFPVGGTQSEFDKGPLVVAEQTTEYATISHRFFTLLAQTMGVHTTNPVRGHITHTVAPKQGLPVTTASPRYRQVLSSSGRQAYTHDDIQGEDFNTEIEVDMSALEEAASDRSAYVALSRSNKGVYLHMNAADPRSVIRAPPTGSDFLNSILYSMRSDNLPCLLNGNDLTRACFYAHMHSCMPRLKWFANVGATLGASAYQSVFSASEFHEVVEGSVDEGGPVDHVMPSTAPVDTFIHETHWHDKESREESRAGLQTDQFKDCAFVNPHVHKRNDHATYKLTVDKRINNATAAQNYTRKKRCPRIDMIKEFHRLCPNLPKWTPDKHAHYMDKARVEYERSRTEAAIRSKLDAHDPERSGSDVMNSLKGQVLKKDEKRSVMKAIAGQMIYEYDISQTLDDAAYALFLEDELFPAFPDSFLFYRRMNPDQFKAAYVKRWRVGNGVHTSDVTRWDVGCDGGVLNFDEDVFRSVCFPSDYVDSYVKRRLSTRSQHGNLATTQPSGDRFTWSMNSIRRAVVASLVLKVTAEDTVAINGDDEAMDRNADALPFPDTVWEFKDQNGLTGEFSGFELGGPVPIYSARGIHYRTMILVSRDPSAQEKWVNYLELLRHADCETWEAMDVARLAHQYMKPELFANALPAPFREHFGL